MPITISVLGSTGSIGTQTLEVAKWQGWKTAGLAAGKNLALAVAQAKEFLPSVLSVNEEILEAAREALPGIKVVSDANEVASIKVDAVVGAIPGLAGLAPTKAALAVGNNVALANKEAMVCGGPLVWKLARQNNARITPLDSEHSALYQCMVGENQDEIAELILTASGGPFRDGPNDLSVVTPELALQHPNWSMGQKVTIDSSTLMNKGLEILEAHFLFEFPLEKISVRIHPQSIIHSMLRFKDGQIKAQLGPADMRLPIQYGVLAATNTPRLRPQVPLSPLPLLGNLELRLPDTTRFPCLQLAIDAGLKAGVAPVALNAADEIVVRAFLEHRLPYLGIPRIIEKVLNQTPSLALTWDSILETDVWARNFAEALVEQEQV